MPLFGPPDVEKLKAKGDVEGLIKALRWSKWQDVSVVHRAAEALGQIGGATAIDALIQALECSEIPGYYARHTVARALGTIGDPGAVGPLLKRISANDDSSADAAWALGQIGDSRAVEPLVAALMSWPIEGVCIAPRARHSRVRAAALALDRLNWRPDSGPAGASYWIAKGQLDKCVEIGAPAVKPLLDRFLNCDSQEREEIINSLAMLGHDAVPALSAAVMNPNSRVSEAASKALSRSTGVAEVVARHDWDTCAKIGPGAIAPLTAALADPSEEVREAAARTLGAIGAAAVETLVNRLGDKDKNVRWQSADALGKIADPAAVSALAAHLDDPDKYVCEAAKRALAKIIAAHPALEPLVELARGDPMARRAAVMSAIAIADSGSDEDKRAVHLLLETMTDETNEYLVSQIARASVRWGYEYIPAKWPQLGRELTGPISVSIDNPNEFTVRVGIRSTDGGTDFMVPARRQSAVDLPPGSYKIYFQYSSEPASIYQGDTLSLNAIQIRLVRVSGGNYQVRKI